MAKNKINKKKNNAGKPGNNKLSKQLTSLVKDVAKVALKDAAAKTLRAGGSAAGLRLGMMAGQPLIGSALGGMLGAKMSRIIGSGDYEAPLGGLHNVTSNSLVKGDGVSTNAQFSVKGGVRVRHREFIKNLVVGSAAYTVDSVYVQPGLAESFPYLSNIAGCYQEYKIHGMVYEYVSSVSEYSSIAQMGTIILGINYNASENAYLSKTAIENSEGAVSARPDKNIVFGVECKDACSPLNKYYVRVGDSAVIPQNLEDYARMQFAMANLPASVYPAGSVVGEMWVSYDIEFLYPRLPTLRPGLYSSSYTGSVSLYPMGLTLQSKNALGTLYNVYQGPDTLYLQDVPIGTTVNIQWVYALTGAAAAFTAGSFLYTNCTGTSVSSPDITNQVVPSSGATTLYISASLNVTVTADNAYVGMLGWTLAAGRTTLFVTSISQGINVTPYGP